MSDKIEPKKKISMGAKDLSKWAQVIAAFWIATFSAVKFLTITPEKVDILDIVVSAVAIAGCFSPTFVSIWIDKIVDLKKAVAGAEQPK